MENDLIDRDEAGDMIASDQVNGTAVFNHAGERLGTISHVMINKHSGNVEYVVLSFGGFLGLGSDTYALPWQKLVYDVNQRGYLVDITKDQLDDAPRYTTDQRDNYDRDYYSGVSGYYGY